jgi:hypothetical protein
MIRPFAFAVGLLLPCSALAQMAGMDMKKAAPSTELVLTGLSGKMKTLTPAEFKALPHVSVKVHNGHADKDESYSGVAVKDLLALVEPAKGEGPKVSGNMIVIVAGATDNFHVAITLCDTNPDCRNGQAIVADAEDGAPIDADGAFKMILTEDKKPARWARNLNSLTVKAVN